MCLMSMQNHAKLVRKIGSIKRIAHIYSVAEETIFPTFSLPTIAKSLLQVHGLGLVNYQI